MIALEVSLDGKRICVAGAEDLCVLTTNVNAVGKLGNKTVPAWPNDKRAEIHYSVGGLTARPDPEKDVHVRWKSVAPLRVGDVIQVKILETDKADRAVSTQKAKRRPREPAGSGQAQARGAGSQRKSEARRA